MLEVSFEALYCCCAIHEPSCFLYLQISEMIAKDVKIHESKLHYFMEQFYEIIRKMDASNKELSIAIRGYGLFAAVRTLLHEIKIH